jgi:hypothetical protein
MKVWIPSAILKRDYRVLRVASGCRAVLTREDVDSSFATCPGHRRLEVPGSSRIRLIEGS